MIYASKAVKLVVCAAILAFPAVAAHPNALKISELESLGRYKKVIESYANDETEKACPLKRFYRKVRRDFVISTIYCVSIARFCCCVK